MTTPSETHPAPDDFPISWEEPADAERSWGWDDMHMPFALTSLAADYIRAIGNGFNLAPELYGGFPRRWHARVWNGYAYFTQDANAEDPERAELSKRWVAVMRERAEVTEAFWADEVLPEVKTLEARLRTIPIESLDFADLALAWDEAWAATERLWQLHFLIILGPYQVLEDLADLYERVVPGASPGESLRLVQGAATELLEADRGLEQMTADAASRPAIRDALLERASNGAPAFARLTAESLRALEGGPGFLAELDAFLAQHGHLGQAFDDLAQPSWAEDISLILDQIGMRLTSLPEPGDARRARLAEDAAALADTVRARLADRPDELVEFDRLVALARAVGPLTEIHNYWIDRLAQARIRALSIRVGHRLAAADVLDTAQDILHLHRAEVRELIQRPASARALIEERRVDHKRNATRTPPANIGPKSSSSEDGSQGPDRFDGERFTSTEADVLRGTGASAGEVRGRAKVVLGPSDFGRIQAGDIIVCPSSNPSWIPVFTLAGGLVTNTGGILSHAAVVAREFGLPAVVGTGDATTRIAEGRLVEIDGSSGIVRLL